MKVLQRLEGAIHLPWSEILQIVRSNMVGNLRSALPLRTTHNIDH